MYWLSDCVFGRVGAASVAVEAAGSAAAAAGSIWTWATATAQRECRKPGSQTTTGPGSQRPGGAETPQQQQIRSVWWRCGWWYVVSVSWHFETSVHRRSLEFSFSLIIILAGVQSQKTQIWVRSWGETRWSWGGTLKPPITPRLNVIGLDTC